MWNWIVIVVGFLFLLLQLTSPSYDMSDIVFTFIWGANVGYAFSRVTR